MFSSFLKNVVNTVAPEASLNKPPSHGFRVLKVRELSPCAKLGVESFYDFIIAIDEITLDGDTTWLIKYLKNAQEQVRLTIWSVKGQVLREVRVPPPSLSNLPLGIALRWCPTHPTIENVYHVLDVAPNSPAARAGLRSHEDFIVGTPEGIVRGESGMSELVDDHLNKPLKLYVNNCYYNTTREVVIIPNRSWGGQGSLGCGIGFGALHRLPAALAGGPPPLEGQTLFEAPTEKLKTGAELALEGRNEQSVDQMEKNPKSKKKTRMTPSDVDAMMVEGDQPKESHTGGSFATAGPPPPKVSLPAEAISPEDKS